MSGQFTFFAPIAPPPAKIVQKEIDRAKREAERAQKAADEAAQQDAAAESFAAFWAVFPKRPNNPKPLARTAWTRALRTATAEEIMEGLGRYEFSPDPKMRPMAVTFLNQQRWACEVHDLSADAHGLAEYLAGLPRVGTLSAAIYDIEDLRPILIATGWPASWRGPLDTMNSWLCDGYIPDSCAKIIASAVAEFGSRGTLAAFDKRVRYRAERITPRGI